MSYSFSDALKTYNATYGTSTPAKTTNPPKSKEPLRYPFKRLDDQSDYLQIQVVEYVPPGLEFKSASSFALMTTDDSISGDKKKVLETIFLPIPEGIQDTNSADWQDAGLNPFEATAAAAGSGGASAEGLGDMVNKFKTNASAKLDSLTSNTAGAQKVVSGLTGGLVASALTGSSNSGAYINRATGFTLNPNSQLLFNGVTARSFSFNWDLVPRGKKEAEVIKQIIRCFKMNMAASKNAKSAPGQGLFIASPNVFFLEYKTGKNRHKFLNKFKMCALTAMSVNYTASGTYATYSDSTPVHMQLSLSFSELTPIYREDYETGQGKDGVGY